MAQYGYVVDTLLPLFDNETSITGEDGVQTFEELRKEIELLSPFEVFRVVINLINNFPKINPVLDAITENGSEAIISEIFMEGEFTKSTDMAKGKSSKPIKRSIAIPVDTYDYLISVDWIMYEKNPQGYMDKMIQSVIESYQKILTKLAMEALMVMPTVTDDPKISSFYFDTSAWTSGKEIIPYPNGFKTFTSSETHYKGYSAYSENILFDLKQLITSKGYGKSGVTYLATASTWRNFQKLDDWSSETKHMFEVDNGFFTGRSGDQYIIVTDGEMADDYIACLDTTKKILKKREDEDPKFKGLYTGFSEMSKNVAIRKAEFKLIDVGYGIQQRGAGALAYVGSTTYVSPTFYQ